MATILMSLLNEGTDVWRPVEATHMGGNRYRVEGKALEGEEWAYASGTVVCCKRKTFSNGEQGLTIVSRIA